MKKGVGEKIIEIAKKKKLTKSDLSFIIAMSPEEYRKYCKLKKEESKTG